MTQISFDFEKPIAEIEERIETIEARLVVLDAEIGDDDAAAEALHAAADFDDSDDSDDDDAEDALSDGQDADEEAATGQDAAPADGAAPAAPREGEPADGSAPADETTATDGGEAPDETAEAAEAEEETASPEEMRWEERARLRAELAKLRKKLVRTRNRIYKNLTPWQRVQIARHQERPHLLDYVEAVFTEWTETHGDRLFADDPGMVCGFALLNDRPVAIVGQQKGSNTRENVERNFGMAHPEGYRKALRIMKMAARFDIPIIVLVDTPGAFPGLGSEERGVAEAIANNMREMFTLATPIIVVIIGEGASGGAIGIGVGDVVLMMENAWYTVISPEGCASILWRDAKFASQAADALKLTPRDLLELGIIDEEIAEPQGGAHHNRAETAANLKAALVRHLKNLQAIPCDELRKARFAKYRRIGEFVEAKA